MLREALHHAAVAERIHDRIGALTRAREASEAVIERLPYGLLWLDAQARVRSVNEAAERLLARRDGLLVRESTLRVVTTAGQKDLDRALAAALDATEGRAGGRASVVRIERIRSESVYTALVAPVHRGAQPLVCDGDPSPAAIVIAVSDPEAARRLATQTLRDLFGLTPALARLAVAIVAGRTLAEYAAAAGVTTGTARQQMKELLVRMGARRQPDLIRIALTSVAQLDG